MKKHQIFNVTFFLSFALSISVIFFPAEKFVSSIYAQANGPVLDIMLVMDNSGSMKENDPDFLSRNVVYSALKLKGDIRFGLVTFESHPRMAVDLSSTTGIASRANILTNLDNMDYTGLYTDTPAAVEMALYELKTNGRKDAHKLIILMTDGIVDTGDKQKDIDRWRWLRDDLMMESKRQGIKIFGIAFNNMADFSLLQTLALNTGGDYFRVNTTEEIEDIFTRILDIAVPSEPKEDVSTTDSGQVKAVSAPDQKTAMAEPGSKVETEGVKKKEEIPAGKNRNTFLLLSGIVGIIFIFVILFILYRIYSRRNMRKRPVVTQSLHDIPRAVLIDINNISGNKSVVLDKRINMIGRDPNNDIVIPKDTVSSFHAIIEYKDGFFYLEDQRSMNNTYLEGEAIQPQAPRRLKSGDEITFNIFKFKFILPDAIPSGKTTIDFHGSSDQIRRKKRAEISGLEIPELPKAILVDADNITGKKTIRLIKRINKIGRGAGNDIEIAKDNISGLHATIEYKDSFFFLEDQKSKNKTCLGGEEMKPHKPQKLKSGDEILFDNYKFIFLLEYELPSGDTGETSVEKGKILKNKNVEH
jgi:pSer/pThr/pTyr-binding forkhead associated (FHA) protein